MAREHKKQLTTAKVPLSATPSTVAPVVASPVDRTVVPKDNPLKGLAEGLATVSPRLKAHLDRKKAEQLAIDTANSTEAANRNNTGDETGALAFLNDNHKSESAEFQENFMSQAGINDANALGRNLDQEYSSWSAQNPNGDLETFINEQITPHVQGLKDKHYKYSFLNTLAPIEAKLREKHTKVVREQIDKAANDAAHTAYYNAFTRVDEETGKYISVTSEDLSKLRSDILKQGHDASEINQFVFDAIVLASKPDANGVSHPEVFDAVLNKGINGASSLGFTSEFGAQIAQAKATAERLAKGEKATLNKVSQADTVLKYTEQVDNGKRFTDKELLDLVFDADANPNGVLTLANVQSIKSHQEKEDDDSGVLQENAYEHTLSKMIDDKLITEHQLLEDPYLKDKPKLQASLLSKWRTANNKENKEAEIDTAFNKGNPLALYGDYSEGDIKKGFERRVNSLRNNFDLNTKEGLTGYISSVIKEGQAAGNLIPKEWSVRMDMANPKLDADNFINQVDFYNSVKNSPYGTEYADRMLSDDKAAQFESYNNLVNVLRIDPQQAISMITNIDEEAIESGERRVLKDYGYDNTRDYVKAELSEVGGILGFGVTEIKGVDGIVDKIVDMAAIRAQDGTSGEEAISWATERFTKVNTLVNGRFYTLPPRQNLGTPLTEAAEWAAKEIEKEFHPDEVPNGIEIRWIPHTKKWIAFNAASGVPVIAEDGKSVEFTEASKLVAEHLEYRTNRTATINDFTVNLTDDQDTVRRKHKARREFEKAEREKEEARLLK